MNLKNLLSAATGVAFMVGALTVYGSSDTASLTLTNQNMSSISVSCAGKPVGSISQNNSLILPFKSIVSQFGVKPTCIFSVNGNSIGSIVIQFGLIFSAAIISSAQPNNGYSDVVLVNGQPSTPPTSFGSALNITLSQN